MIRNACFVPSSRYLIFAFSLVLLLTSCEDDDDAIGLGGPAGTECGNDSNCPGDAICDNGRCECSTPDAALAPGFCVQTSYPNTFVTFDSTLGCIDTTLIAFLEDPFALTWPVGVSNQSIPSYVYNRNPNGVFATGAALAQRPSDVTAGADSLYIINIYGPDGFYCNQDNWSCRNSFYGAFIGRDTLRGVLQFIGCNDRNSGTSLPEQFTKRYSMTFVRVN